MATTLTATGLVRMRCRLSMLLIALSLISASATSAAPAVADLVLTNGRVFTGDPTKPWAEAVAIKGERIVAVGSTTEIVAKAGKAETIDLRGRLLVPGINDAHDHAGAVPFGVEAHTQRSPMEDPPLAEVAEAVRKARAIAPPGAWIWLTTGATAMFNPNGTRAAIAEAAQDHPVLIKSWWGHGVILNDAGLKALGIGQDVVDPPGGRYQRDASGRLNGKLEEYAGWIVLEKLHSGSSAAVAAQDFQDYAKRRLSEGVTSVQIMAGYLEPKMFVRTVAQSKTMLRVRLVPFPLPTSANVDAVAPWRSLYNRDGPGTRVFGTKWILDGTPIDGNAWSSRPYTGRFTGHGYLNFDKAFIERELSRAVAGGEQLLLHVTGDATMAYILDAMEKIAPPARWRSLRPRIEHSQGLKGDLVRRAAALGIIVAQPRQSTPMRDLTSGGITVAYGSDEAFSPFLAMKHMTSASNPQAITREQAMVALTHGGAWAEFAEKDKGRIRPGMLADVVILSQDVLAVPEAELPKTRSLMSIVGGKIAYRAPEFR